MRTVIGITGKLDVHGLITANTGYELSHLFLLNTFFISLCFLKEKEDFTSDM